MIGVWMNLKAKVQRRDATPSRNSLGEPDYGAEDTYPTIYTDMPLRIEYWDERMSFTEIGERIEPSSLVCYIEPEFTIKPEDRLTITSSDATASVGQRYIVGAVYPLWNAVGGVNHYECQLTEQ